MTRHRPPAPLPVVAAIVLAIVAALACSSRPVEDTRQQALAQAGSSRARAAAPLDPSRPLEALHATADEVATRVGSLAWEGEVRWTVSRTGVAPVHAAERHRVVQLASGDFEATSDIDPGTGPGSETGRSVIRAGGATYARSRWAPFRERPTDRGQAARRFRDDSFRMAADLADLYGPALEAQPAGEVTLLGRPARRFRLALGAKRPAPRPLPEGLPANGLDADTKRRLAFLEGRVPVAAEGELVLDAASGVPLSVALKGAFSERDDPELRAEFELTAEVHSLGSAAPPVRAPKGALADERKPKGVARALEAAGLRRKAPAPGEREPEEGEQEAE